MQHFRVASLSAFSVSSFHLLHVPCHFSYVWVCFFSPSVCEMGLLCKTPQTPHARCIAVLWKKGPRWHGCASTAAVPGMPNPKYLSQPRTACTTDGHRELGQPGKSLGHNNWRKFSWLQNRITCSGRPGTHHQLCWVYTAQCCHAGCSWLTLLCLATASASRHLTGTDQEHEGDKIRRSVRVQLTGPEMTKPRKKHHHSLVPLASCCPMTPGGHRTKLVSRGKWPGLCVTHPTAAPGHSSGPQSCCLPRLLQLWTPRCFTALPLEQVLVVLYLNWGQKWDSEDMFNTQKLQALRSRKKKFGICCRKILIGYYFKWLILAHCHLNSWQTSWYNQVGFGGLGVLGFLDQDTLL